MRNIETARAYIRDAAIIIDEAAESLSKGHFHRTVRKCQEGVELSLKGLLRLKGIEYPRSHKIGQVVIEALKDDLESGFLHGAADLADKLAIDREPSFYGTDGVPAGKLFDEDDARNILTDSRVVVDFIKSLLTTVSDSNR